MAVHQPAANRGAAVPTIETASSRSALRSLGRRGIRTTAVSDDETAPGYRSTYTDDAVSVPNSAIDPAAAEASDPS